VEVSFNSGCNAEERRNLADKGLGSEVRLCG
jgi:hypothetical protein